MLKLPKLNKDAPRYADFQRLCTINLEEGVWYKGVDEQGAIIFTCERTGMTTPPKVGVYRRDELDAIAPELGKFIPLLIEDYTDLQYVPAENASKTKQFCTIKNAYVKVIDTWNLWTRFNGEVRLPRMPSDKKRVNYLIEIAYIFKLDEKEKTLELKFLQHVVDRFDNKDLQTLGLGRREFLTKLFTFKQINKALPGFLERLLVAKTLGLSTEEQLDYAIKDVFTTQKNGQSVAVETLDLPSSM